MLQHFTPRHIPPLLVATATTFGGLWPLWDPPAAMLEFGLPPRVASSSTAAPLMVLCSARTTVLGALVFLFYGQGKLAEVDAVLGVMGAYLGLMDGIVCWREGMGGKGLFRFLSGMGIAAWGVWGLTRG